MNLTGRIEPPLKNFVRSGRKGIHQTDQEGAPSVEKGVDRVAVRRNCQANFGFELSIAALVLGSSTGMRRIQNNSLYITVVALSTLELKLREYLEILPIAT
jgi:hypothetical protein